jgi:hypothetical protein
MISKDNSAIAGKATAFGCPASEVSNPFAFAADLGSLKK